MPSLNKVILVGRLTRDPEMRYTTSGLAVTNFTIAVDRRSKNQQGERQTDFFRCSAWRQTAEFVSNYLGKGRLVAVEGRIELNEYTGQDGQKKYSTDIVCDHVEGLDSPRDREDGGGGYGGGAPRTGGAQAGGDDYSAEYSGGGGGDNGYFPDDDMGAGPQQRGGGQMNNRPAEGAPRSAAGQGTGGQGAGAPRGGAPQQRPAQTMNRQPARPAQPAYPADDDFDDSDPFADE